MRFTSNTRRTVLLFVGLSLFLTIGFTSARFTQIPQPGHSDPGIHRREFPTYQQRPIRGINFDQNDVFYGLSQSASNSTTARKPRVAKPTPANKTTIVEPTPTVVKPTDSTPSAPEEPAKNQTLASAKVESTSKVTLASDSSDDHSGYEWLKPDDFRFSQDGEERKYTGNFPWWLTPLIALGLILIALLIFCTMSKSKNKPIQNRGRPAGNEDAKEAAIEREIAQQLQQRNQNNIQNA